MSVHLMLLVLIPVAYVIGSVPFGLLIGRMRGVDVRAAGSGNIGATNVARVLGGTRWFFLVFFLDLSKSLVPLLVASAVVHQVARVDRDAVTYLLWLGVGLAAVLGHMFSLFLNFTGGKGVATSCGVLLGLVPYFLYPGLVAIAVFLVVFAASRYVSLGSIAGAAAFPAAYVGFAVALGWDWTGRQLPLLALALVMCGLVIYKHRGNIARLRAGTEHRMGHRAPPPDAQAGGSAHV